MLKNHCFYVQMRMPGPSLMFGRGKRAKGFWYRWFSSIPEASPSAASCTSSSAPSTAHACTARKVSLPDRPELDFDFLLDGANTQRIADNVRLRKAMGDVHRVRALWTRLRECAPFGARNAPAAELSQLWEKLYAEASLLPNLSDPEAPVGNADAARCVEVFGERETQTADAGDWTPLQAEQLVSGWHSLQFPRKGSGARAYALIGSLANMQRALLDHAFEFLYARLRQEPDIGRLEMLDVDDILPVSTTRACGLQQRPAQPAIQYRVFNARDLRHDEDVAQQDTSEPRNPEIEPADANAYGGLCLSGTAEMGIAHRLRGRTFDEREFPVYFMAQSHCFRPEVATGAIDSGLYRVHEFDKVELFVVCTERQSGAELQRLVRIQRALFSSLELHCRILDMPSEELGAPAARKFDTEAWMPGRKAWGELASASNCTDFQARRLHLKYRPSSGGEPRFVHTCNGTGLASTRALVALLETHQNGRRKGLNLPEALRQRLPAKHDAGIRVGMAKDPEYNFKD